MSYPEKRTNRPGGRFMWDSYSYCDIELKDGRKIIITSLLVPDMNKFVEDLGVDSDRIEKIGGFYNIV